MHAKQAIHANKLLLPRLRRLRESWQRDSTLYQLGQLAQPYMAGRAWAATGLYATDIKSVDNNRRGATTTTEDSLV